MDGESVKVIVTGGAGFIGSAVVRAFVDRHRAQVAVFDNMTYAASPQTLRPTGSVPTSASISATSAT